MKEITDYFKLKDQILKAIYGLDSKGNLPYDKDQGTPEHLRSALKLIYAQLETYRTKHLLK